MAEYLTDTTALTKVAEAIRAKGGTSEPLKYPDGFVAAIGNIGSTSTIARNLLTATEDVVIKDLLDQVEVKCTYANSIIFMGCYDDVTPTSGNYTIGNYQIWHTGRTIKFAADRYISGLASFTSFRSGILTNETTSSMAITADGRIVRNESTTSCCTAAGGTFKFVEIPFNFDTFLPDYTLWGASNG